MLALDRSDLVTTYSLQNPRGQRIVEAIRPQQRRVIPTLSFTFPANNPTCLHYPSSISLWATTHPTLRPDQSEPVLHLLAPGIGSWAATGPGTSQEELALESVLGLVGKWYSLLAGAAEPEGNKPSAACGCAGTGGQSLPGKEAHREGGRAQRWREDSCHPGSLGSHWA